MFLIQFLLIGLAAGWILGRITRGRGFGWFGNLFVGALGSLIGGYLFGFLGVQARSPVQSLGMAVLGAAALFVLLSFLRPARKRRRPAGEEDDE